MTYVYTIQAKGGPASLWAFDPTCGKRNQAYLSDMSSFGPHSILLTSLSGAADVLKTLTKLTKRGAGERASIAELDRVTLAQEVEGDYGERVPAGSTGTVVGIWAGGAAFEVEFTQPVDALATVKAGAIASHQPRR